MEGMGARVLVVDDEAPIRLLCRVNLEAEGMSVLEAADGASGLDLARDEQPDVVLLDVMMPGLDGWRVAEELLEDDRTSGIPIIFLTARAAQLVQVGIRSLTMAEVRERENPVLAGRPEPDEAEPPDSAVRRLSLREWRGIFVRAVKRFLADNGTMLASALAYSTFFAIP